MSGILSAAGGPARVIDAFIDGQFTLVTSEPLLAEVADVLARPRIARRSRFTPGEISDLVAAMRALGEVVSVTSERGICRGPDDDVVIETAITGRADVLVSGDQDLTADPTVVNLLTDAGIRLLTVAQLVAELTAVGS